MTEMEKFYNMALDLNVDITINDDFFEMPQVRLHNSWDAICNPLSRGYEQGLLELWGESWEDAIGFLTAEEAISYLREHHYL